MKIERRRRRGGQIGNKNGQKHGCFSNRFSAEEEEERRRFEEELTADLGAVPSTAQKVLVRRASFLEVRLRRSEKASGEGYVIPDLYLLSWINSQRLILKELGIERKVKAAVDLQTYLKRKAIKRVS